MTTIAWDGKTLAADSRRSYGLKYAHDDVVKLFVFKNEELYLVNTKTKERLKIVAGGGSGSAEAVHCAFTMLDETPMEFRHFHEVFRKAGIHANSHFQMVVVAGDRLFRFAMGDRFFVDTDAGVKGRPSAIGSGSKVAEWLMKAFKAPSQLAIAAAALTDPGTGGSIHTLTFKKGKIVEQSEIHYPDRNEIYDEIQKCVAGKKISKTPILSSNGIMAKLKTDQHQNWRLDVGNSTTTDTKATEK